MSHRPAVRTLLYALALFLVVSATGRADGAPQEKKISGAALRTRQAVNVCALLTSAELQATIGEPLEEARPSAQPAGKIQTSQCLFRTTTFAKSVSLTLATSSGTSSSALREFWRNQFHAKRETEERADPERGKAPASEEEMENDARKPRPVSGLGDEAFWVGSPISGALYVLRGDAFVRVSVGGTAQESSRLAKSKVLAAAAIARLHN